jgi:hypothetical protein
VRGGFGPRFVVEAIFLVAVATIAGLAKFPTEAIVLVMALAWLLVAGVEWALARPGALAALRRRAEGCRNASMRACRRRSTCVCCRATPIRPLSR